MTTKQIPTITPELKAAVEVYLLAKAYTAAIRPVVEAYQAEVVAASNLQYAEEFAPSSVGTITSMKDSWMMDDRYADDFYNALDAAHAAHGFTGLAHGYCPLLIAEYDEIKAKWAICDASEYITGVNAKGATGSVDLFNQFTEAAVQFVMAVCKDITTESLMQRIAPRLEAVTA